QRSRLLVGVAVSAGSWGGPVFVERLKFPGTPFYFKDGVMLPDYYSFGSTIGHTNFLAAYVALILGPLAGLLCSHGRWRAGRAASGATMVWVLVLARSIGALVGVSAATLMVLVVGLIRARSRGVKAALVILASLMVVVAAEVTVSKLNNDKASVTVRAATLRIGFAAVQERPWLGFGTNGFARESSRIERELFGRELLELHRANQPFSAHD